MKQEHKELLLKDLSSRLPYGVKVLCLRDFNHTCYKLEMIDIEDNEVYLTRKESYANRYVEIKDVKPYLFPLSSMTEEEIKEYKHLVAFSGSPDGAANFTDWLNKKHFDYRWLIPMGLALDATGLNIY